MTVKHRGALEQGSCRHSTVAVAAAGNGWTRGADDDTPLILHTVSVEAELSASGTKSCMSSTLTRKPAPPCTSNGSDQGNEAVHLRKNEGTANDVGTRRSLLDDRRLDLRKAAQRKQGHDPCKALRRTSREEGPRPGGWPGVGGSS